MNTRLALFSLACLLFAAPGFSQVQRSGNDSARVAQQMQQVAAEKLELQSEIAALKKDNEELKKQLDKSTAEQKALTQRAASLETAAKSRDQQAGQHATEELEKSRAQLQELVGRFRETAQTLRDVEQDRNEARSSLKAKDMQMNTCAKNNVQLADLANEVLDRYERKGVWASINQAEPFTGIKRARVQNLADEYRGRVEDLKLQSRETSTPQKSGG